MDWMRRPGRNLRIHISHGYLRKVRIDGKEYVYDDKNPSRRRSPETVEGGGHTVDFFEFHAVIAETDVWKQLDIPEVVMREHRSGDSTPSARNSDLVRAKIRRSLRQYPTRPTFGDLRYFFYRWQKRFVRHSHDQFEKRWGYRFSNEQYISNWAFRRKVFSTLRYLWVPHKPADFASRAAVKLFCPPIPQKFLFKEDDNHELVLGSKERGSEQSCNSGKYAATNIS